MHVPGKIIRRPLDSQCELGGTVVTLSSSPLITFRIPPPLEPPWVRTHLSAPQGGGSGWDTCRWIRRWDAPCRPAGSWGQGRGEVTSSRACRARMSGCGLPGRPQCPERAPLLVVLALSFEPGPCPSLILFLRWAGRGPQLCAGSWPSALTDSLPTEEWPVSTPGKPPAWPGGRGSGRGDSGRLASVCQAPAPRHTVAWVTPPPAFAAPSGGASPVASSPRGLGPAPWAAPPLPCPHPQDMLAPSLCPGDVFPH